MFSPHCLRMAHRDTAPVTKTKIIDLAAYEKHSDKTTFSVLKNKGEAHDDTHTPRK